MDKMEQKIRRLNYSVKLWKLKCLKLMVRESFMNGLDLGPISSPLPSLSPMPTRGSALPNKFDDFLQRPDVVEYVDAVNKAIDEKVKVFGITPKTISQIIAKCSPHQQKAGTPIKKHPLSVSKKLILSSNRKKGKVAWGAETPAGGYRGVSAIKEVDDVNIHAHVYMMHMYVDKCINIYVYTTIFICTLICST
jgi:hypothetical protein